MTPRIVLACLAAAVLTAAAAAAGWVEIDAGRGPVAVRVPDAAAPPAGRPLMVLLHGYGASGALQESYLQLSGLAVARGFLYAIPDGTVNLLGDRFWNATDACCDFFGSGVNDEAYLEALVDAIDAALDVDPRRVVFLGHSNGAFMAYRMACSAADRVVAAGGLAGATFLDPADCAPLRPVRILHVHGTADGTIAYGGGATPLGAYPGAEASVATWSAYDGCIPTITAGGTFDADSSLPGAETEIERYLIGCRGGGAELWRIVGGAHVPSLTATFRQRLIDWTDTATTDLFADAFESGDTRAWAAVTP